MNVHYNSSQLSSFSAQNATNAVWQLGWLCLHAPVAPWELTHCPRSLRFLAVDVEGDNGREEIEGNGESREGKKGFQVGTYGWNQYTAVMNTGVIMKRLKVDCQCRHEHQTDCRGWEPVHGRDEHRSDYEAFES